MDMGTATSIRIRGQVQGVGFRPFVWHLASELGISGSVRNDAEGVLIHAWGEHGLLHDFRRRMSQEAPPLARIDSMECLPLDARRMPAGFNIVGSHGSGGSTASVTPDAATCPHCRDDILDPNSRHFGYPFTSCTHCGPRLSIVHAIPYDRPNTSMHGFAMCPACRSEYDDPANRRFHAQTHACPQCGPQIWLEDAAGHRLPDAQARDAEEGHANHAIAAAARLLHAGKIVAIKGIGGVHLAVDAGNDAAVARLRVRKQRDDKPFALMAADLEQIARYARVCEAEKTLLSSTAAPIVLLERRHDAGHLAGAIAPGQSRLGFMLPYSPLHSLLMRHLQQPIVLTSGNRSDEPQCTDNEEARERLAGIADAFLLHDRDIVNRLDDSVSVFMGDAPRLLRRARGYAPAPVLLHESLSRSPRILAMGGEMKSTFCQLNAANAVVSQHLGDLEHAATREDYRRALALYAQMTGFTAQAIAVDMHPDYFSTRLGQQMAQATGIPLIAVQHHHAHVAAVLAEHRIAPGSAPVLGIALDGLGFGEDGTIWGGEFLLADYRQSRRLGRFQPVAMPGGTQAIREPWRNTFAHLHALGTDKFRETLGEGDMAGFFAGKPLALLHGMIDKDVNSPLTSSCGRLFDAVAAALGICRDQISYEGQAAIELESLARQAYSPGLAAFPWSISLDENGVAQIGWQPMWQALFGEINAGLERAVIAARFHLTVSAAVSEMAARLCHDHAVTDVVLCGGAFQNRLLFEATVSTLKQRNLNVLTPQHMPMGDGGLSLGQAAIAAARLLQGRPSYD